MNKILEVDLSKPVCDFLIDKGYSVRTEVNYCDICGVKEDKLVVVELKRNLSVELLTQAVKRQRTADLVYIAIPKPKRMTFNQKWKDICHLIRRLELGLILVSFKDNDTFIEIPIEPKPFDRIKSIQMGKKKREGIIKEIEGRYCDLNTGGSRGEKLVTSYRESAVFIACCLEKYGPMSPKKLRELGTDKKKTTSILSQNHYGWFYKLSRGLYNISEEGRKELKEYSKLVEYYLKKI